ncbi:MAG: endonuclease/exonuclease/phosphatase family protein [Nocardioides sp.]|nr:endonuclease/exonuclease/phosphatase family protein [Nocardioides sp.]
MPAEPSRRRRPHRALGLALVTALVAVAAWSHDLAPSAAIADVESDELHVMSFNLRHATAPGPSWRVRRPLVRALIHQEEPHLVGTQEGQPEQLAEIDEDLGRRYGSLRRGKHAQEPQFFFDRRRLRPLETGHYALSDAPDEVGSRGWGGCCARSVFWVRFRDEVTSQQFYAVNTHLEAFSARARRKSAALILERMQAFDSTLPVVLTGDFNEPAGQGRPVHRQLVGSGRFVDTWEQAARRSKLVGTFHKFGRRKREGGRIDWVLTSPGVTTRRAAINTFAVGGRYPSDHFPVQAVIRFPTP